MQLPLIVREVSCRRKEGKKRFPKSTETRDEVSYDRGNMRGVKVACGFMLGSTRSTQVGIPEALRLKEWPRIGGGGGKWP